MKKTMGSMGPQRDYAGEEILFYFFPEGLQPVVGYTGAGKSVKRKEWQRGAGLD